MIRRVEWGDGLDESYDRPTVLDRVDTQRGELVLRRYGGRYEIISNGVFLMDTSGGSSERLLVDAALARCASPAPRVLIGGLGVGYSLVQAASHARVTAIDVVEIEPVIIEWHTRFLGHLTGAAQQDPRVRIIASDIAAWLDAPGEPYDVICLDTDNGPNWLVWESNAVVYSEFGVDRALRRLRLGGVLAVWSARRDEEYERRLRQRAAALEIVGAPHQRGEPDVVYIAVKGSGG